MSAEINFYHNKSPSSVKKVKYLAFLKVYTMSCFINLNVKEQQVTALQPAVL